MKTRKRQTGIRLTTRADEILEQFSTELGVSKTAIIELALREFKEKRDNSNEQKEKNN